MLLEEDIGIAASHDDGSAAALLTFNAGRRSFGSFNPRLEKRLAEIGSNQRTVRQEQQNAAKEAEERRIKAAEHEDLMRRADADEAKERQNSVSDAELAASFAKKYGKYLPAPAKHEVRGVHATTMPPPEPPPKPPPLPSKRFGNDAFADSRGLESVKMRDAAKRSKTPLTVADRLERTVVVFLDVWRVTQAMDGPVVDRLYAMWSECWAKTPAKIRSASP